MPGWFTCPQENLASWYGEFVVLETEKQLLVQLLSLLSHHHLLPKSSFYQVPPWKELKQKGAHRAWDQFLLLHFELRGKYKVGKFPQKEREEKKERECNLLLWLSCLVSLFLASCLLLFWSHPPSLFCSECLSLQVECLWLQPKPEAVQCAKIDYFVCFSRQDKVFQSLKFECQRPNARAVYRAGKKLTSCSQLCDILKGVPSSPSFRESEKSAFLRRLLLYTVSLELQPSQRHLISSQPFYFY